MTEVPKVRIGGLPIVALTREAFAALMVDDCLAARSAEPQRPPHISFSANGELLSLNARDPELAAALAKADTIDADGQSLVLFSRLCKGQTIPERVSTTDFFHDAAREAEARGLSFYFLGGTSDALERCLQTVRRMYPGLAVAGHRNGYFSEAEEADVIQSIREAKPDVVWVGMGTPRQQLFAIRARDQVPGVGWIKTCGGLFNFLSGEHRRAPKWLQACGLEWAFRLALEPRRLFWRYAITNPHAIYLMLRRSGR